MNNHQKIISKFGLIAVILLFITYLVIVIQNKVYAQENLFQGYHEEMTVNRDTRYGIKISDEGEQIAYCYNYEKGFPSKKDATYNGNDDRCFYSKTENYLESNDDYINTYGVEKKQKIALALFVGYPNNGYGDYIKQITESEARYMTQNLIWDITAGREGKYTPHNQYSEGMCKYYNQLYKKYFKNFKEDEEFFLANPSIQGDVTMKKIHVLWYSGLLTLNGIRGLVCDIELSCNDKEAHLYHKDGSPVTYENPICNGEEFFIVTPNKPTKQILSLNWYTKAAKFIFYKHEKGGKNTTKGENNVQNLIRVKEYTQSGSSNYIMYNDGKAEEYNEKMFDIKINKEWMGNIATDSVKAWVIADGNKQFYVELTKNEGWTKTIKVPERNSFGNKISYSIKEDGVRLDSVIAINGTNYISKVETTLDRYKIINQEIYEPQKLTYKDGELATTVKLDNVTGTSDQAATIAIGEDTVTKDIID
ncbi:Fibronectin-binding protein signal sequence, partial [Granulicatella balaenopterae]